MGISLSLFAVACAGDVGFSDPPPPTDGGDHLRPGFTVNSVVAPEAASVARALGWADGVPGAEVRVHRFGTNFSWETALADDRGTASLPRLVTGQYRVAVYRPLSAAETLATGVEVLAAGRMWPVAARGTERTIELVPNQPGSLVISEVYAPATFVAELRYNFHMYFEVYNNSDRTVFLDGLTFGRVQLINAAGRSVSCAESAQFRKDPDGVWAEFLHRFPGAGGEYPLAPGEAAVVALDAIDHTVVHPDLPGSVRGRFRVEGKRRCKQPGCPGSPRDRAPVLVPRARATLLRRTCLVHRGEARSGSAGANRLEPSFRGMSPMVRVPASALIDVVWTEEG